MSQHRKKRAVFEMGHDSFLDIVANLVGILIILVVVLGTQSTAVIEEIKDKVQEDQSEETELASEAQLSELAKYSMRAAAAQADTNRLEDTVREYDSKIRIRNRCNITGRPRAFIRRYGLSRLTFRELALDGKIPGVTKSSW